MSEPTDREPGNIKEPLHMLNQQCAKNSGSALGCALPADSTLSAQGWEKRFLADARMAKEAVQTYSELGYEVRLEPLREDEMKDECSGCKSLLKHFKTVYTRKKK